MIRVSGLKMGVCTLIVLGYLGCAKPTLAITGGAWQTKVVNWTRVPANDRRDLLERRIVPSQ